MDKGPIGCYTEQITSSLVAGGLGFAFAGPAGAAVGVIVGAFAGLAGKRYLNNEQKGNKPPAP